MGLKSTASVEMLVMMHCIILAVLLFPLATCDVDKDREECANYIGGVATCLPYVTGESRILPTECCNGFKLVLQQKPLCICLLIKDRNDPSLGLQINATLALSVPNRCNAPADDTIASCPKLLKLPPNSPDAKVFQDFVDSVGKGKASAHAPAHAPAGSLSSGGSSSTTAATASSPNSDGGKRIEMVPGLLLVVVAAHVLPINLY